MLGFMVISALLILGMRVTYVGYLGIAAKLGKDWAIVATIGLFVFPVVFFVFLLFYPDGRRVLRQIKMSRGGE